MNGKMLDSIRNKVAAKRKQNIKHEITVVTYLFSIQLYKTF